MAGILDALATKIGVPGRKIYETNPKPPSSFSQMSLKEKLQSLVLYYRTADREQRIRRHITYYLTALYYRGYQSVELTQAGSSIDVFEREDFFVENQFRKSVDAVKNILNRMEGDLVVRPASDNPRDIATSRVAEPVLEMQRDAVGYERMKDQKNLFKCLFGNSFQFTDYVTGSQYGSIVTPKFDYKTMPGPDGEDMLSKVVSGYSKRYRGSQVGTVCSPLEINCPSEILPFTEIPYLQWISRQDVELLNYNYPGLNMTGGVSSVEEDLAQQYIDILGNLPGNLLGDSLAYNRGSSMRKKAELVRTWLKPCAFRGEKDLEREFPDGAHITTVNGKVVDFYNENMCDRWTHEVLIPVPHSLLGDGLYDAILMQDQINELDSLMIQHTRYTTCGKTYYNSNVLKASEKIINDPSKSYVPVDVGLEGSIQNAIMRVDPTTLSADVPKWRESMLQAMQDMTSYDVALGKSLGANTPYSQSVFLTERAQSRWKGTFDYNRPEVIRFNKQLLEDARTNWVDMRQRAVIDNTGQWSFQQFSQADLQGDVDIYLSDADMAPKTRAEQIQGLTMLTTLAPLLPGLPPKQKLRVEEILALPPDANPMSNQISRAYRMIDRIKKGETVSPLPLVDNPMAQVPVFADFLVSEEGEALAETQAEIFANIYGYMTTLTMMGMMAQASPGGAMATNIAGHVPPQQQQQPGGAPPAGPDKQPGGQMGQKGGGPGAGEQPEAQSPAPAPPVAPPNA